MSDPIKILFVGATPEDMPLLDLRREAESIQRRLGRAEHGRRFQLIQRWMTEVKDLPGLLMQYRPQIVHFSGHGARDGRLDFHGPDGRAMPAEGPAIAELFRVLDGVRCVVLNACYSTEQARQIAAHVDAVVGMSAAVSDEDAVAFAAGFYEALGHGQDVRSAFELGRLQIGLGAGPSVDVCALHVREGVDASRLRMHEAGAGARADVDWLACLRRGIVRTVAPPQLSGFPGAELRAGVTIDELFVGPLLERHGEGAHLALEMLTHFYDESRRRSSIRFEDFERAWFGTVEGLEREPPLRVIVRGGPGSGKSMICRHLVVRAANVDGLLPLLFRVRDWADGTRRGILEHIALWATEVLGIPTTDGQLEVLCSAGSAQLLVDGFDELPLAEHRSLCERLQGFASTYPAMPILVTSRPALTAASKLGLDSFVELQLAPFTEEQLHAFATRWGERLVNSTSESLWRALEAEPHAMHLARIPLFAALLAFIHARRGQLPVRRTRLYEQCIDEMLVVWPEQQHARQLPEATGDHLRPLLEDLALVIQSRRDDNLIALFGFSKVSLTDEDLDERLAEGLSRSRPELDVGERLALRRKWRRWLIDDSGLLNEPKPGHYEFTHLSMVEYLAARAAQRGHGLGDVDPLVELVRARYEFPSWRNTLLFLLDDRRDTELANAVFAALLDEEHHEDTLTFLLILLREGHRVSEELCLRLLETCLDPERARAVPFSLYVGDILTGEAHGEVLRRWFVERITSERGDRLAGLLMSLPAAFAMEAHLERRPLDSLEPLALLDHEVGGLGAHRGQLFRALALVPNGFRLRWALNHPVNEIVAQARRSLELLPQPWPQRWIPALLARAAWLSSLPVGDVPTSRWAVENVAHWAPARLAFSCRCDDPRQQLGAIEGGPATIEGRSFTVFLGHDYLRSLRALPPDASPARVAAAIRESLPPESFPSSDVEDLRNSFERLPMNALERVTMPEAEPAGAPGPWLPDGFPHDLLVGLSRGLAVIAEVHTASLGADPVLANEIAVVRLLHLALLWDLDPSIGAMSLSRASPEQQALYLALALAQFQTTWTWPCHARWRELMTSEPPADGLVAHLWHLCRHVAGVGDGGELDLAHVALERGVDTALAATLRAYRIETVTTTGE